MTFFIEKFNLYKKNSRSFEKSFNFVKSDYIYFLIIF